MRRTLLPLLVALAALPAGDAAAATVTEPDPGGGAAWTVTTQSRGARDCATLARGETVAREFCARLGGRSAFLSTVHLERPADQNAWRTVYVVLLSRSVVSATMSGPNGVVRYRRGRGPRVMMAVAAGAAEQPFLAVSVRTGGRMRTSTSGRPPGAVVGDPFGGPAWTVTRTRRCVRWRRVAAPPVPEPAEGGDHCGTAAGRLSLIGLEEVAGRFVIVGLAARNIRRVTLRGPGSGRVAFERRGRSFIAVLPARVDRSKLTLVLRTARGRRLERRLG